MDPRDVETVWLEQVLGSPGSGDGMAALVSATAFDHHQPEVLPQRPPHSSPYHV